MAHRAQFLAAIRDAVAAGAPAPSHAASHAHAAPPADVDATPPPPRDRASLLTQLARVAELQGWHVVRADTAQEAAGHVVRIAAGHGARVAVRTAHPVLERIDVDAALAAAGVDCTLLAAGPGGLDAAQRQAAAAAADVGVTGVDAVIAETATVAIAPRRGVSRQASLLPPVHVAVADESQVVADLGEALARQLADSADAEDPRWHLNLISGPSRTADIEQTLVVGVHGPGEVHLILLKDE